MKEKIFAILVFGVLLFSGCLQNTSDIERPIGGDKDEHGCLIAAGYSWNESVNACIREWELDESQRKAAKIAVDYVGYENGTAIIEVIVFRCPSCFTVKLQNSKGFLEIKLLSWKVSINNFEECVAAGNPVMESYPRQCNANGKTFVETIEPIIVKQSGGSAMLIKECANKTYMTEIADYIIEGIIEKVESKWNDERTSIFTYSDIAIEKYLKGTPFSENKIQIITPGGAVGEITQAVEDQPIFHEGKRVRLYLEKTNGEFSIVCAQMGVEEIFSESTDDRLNCREHTYSSCPEGCIKICEASVCSDEGICTADCDGPGSCAPAEYKMTIEEAKKIAEKSECTEKGILTESYFYNNNSKTWWIDLEMKEEFKKDYCSPACVVSENTGTAEINWRCTGLIV